MGKPTTHNTKECRRFDQNGNQLALFARGQLKKNSHKSKEKEETLSNKSYAQIAKAVAKVLKAWLKKPKRMGHIMYVDKESDSDANSSNSK